MRFARKVPESARLLARLEANSIPVPEAGCWLWTGYTRSYGYGVVTDHGRQRLATRAAYQAHTGIDPGALDVCHKCDTPSCVNPDHLFLGSAGDNLRDMYRKGRRHQVGERNGRALLSEAEAAEVIASKEPRAFLAAKFGVSKSTIVAAQMGLNWRHLHPTNEE